MATVYSTHLLSATVLTPGTPQAFLTPPGFVCVLRDVDVFANLGVSAGDLILADSYTGAGFWYIDTTHISGFNSFQWRGRQVFPYVEGEAQGFQFETDAGTNTWYVRASGYLLSQP